MTEKEEIDVGLKILDLFIKIGLPILTFVLGFIVSRFSMTKKERKDYQAKLQENSNALLGSLDESFQRFTLELKKYAEKDGSPSLTEFYAIATSGESYFAKLTMLCDSILAGTVDKKAIRNTHVQSIREAVERSLPAFYDTLNGIAEKNELDYNGKLEKEKHASIYQVYNKYCLNQ